MKNILLIAIWSFTILGFSQDRILLDDDFSDWINYPVLFSDVSGDDGSSGIDFGELKMANDENFIFISIEVGTEINLQQFNEIAIYIDTDNDASTGEAMEGIGAELMYVFGDREGTVWFSGNSQAIRQNDIGLVSSPTVTSHQFEISIKREADFFGSVLFPEDSFRVVLKDNDANGDVLPGQTGGVSYTLSNTAQEPLPEYYIQKKSSTDFRVLSYNVLNDGIFDTGKLPAFTRILQAIQPDIIGFQEIYNATSLQVANQVESILPSATGEAWFHANAGPDIHVVSRYPILETYKVDGYNAGAGNGAFLIDLPGIDEDLLFLVAHTPCCTNDAGRQVEIDEMMAFIRNAKSGSGPLQLKSNSPIIIAGDMNLVGENQQLNTLLTGNIDDEFTHGADFQPDWDETALMDCKPPTTNLPMSFTWFSENSSFSPGRLDFMIYSDSRLSLQNGYSLFTSALISDSLDAYGLLAEDVVVASDHLPIVGDFEFNDATPIDPLKQVHINRIINVFPNPSSGHATLYLSMAKPSSIMITIQDMVGRSSSTILTTHLSQGMHSIPLDFSRFSAGVYLIGLHSDGVGEYKKMVILR